VSRSRRAIPVSHPSHDRWLVSYADFITLLFGFFVVMFASAQAGRGTAREVSESVRAALEHRKYTYSALGAGKTAGAGGTASTPAPPDLVRSLDRLSGELGADIITGKVQLKLESRGLVISLREAGFFASGGDAVEPSSLPMLQKIAAVAGALPNAIRLEGHTDSVPIHNSRFRSNWELSVARSIAVLEVLNTRFQIPISRLAVAGYAENSPADDNGSDEGRAHNRRVDIVVLTAEAVRRAEPPPGPASKP
jgi:chemotaxis protein MotB